MCTEPSVSSQFACQKFETKYFTNGLPKPRQQNIHVFHTMISTVEQFSKHLFKQIAHFHTIHYNIFFEPYIWSTSGSPWRHADHHHRRHHHDNHRHHHRLHHHQTQPHSFTTLLHKQPRHCWPPDSLTAALALRSSISMLKYWLTCQDQKNNEPHGLFGVVGKTIENPSSQITSPRRVKKKVLEINAWWVLSADSCDWSWCTRDDCINQWLPNSWLHC